MEEHLIEDAWNAIMLLGEYGERGGIGNPIAEVDLVDVEPYAYDCCGNLPGGESGVEEGTADFVVAYIDVVGPLDEDLMMWQICSEQVADGYGNGLGDLKLMGRGDEGRMEYYGTSDVGLGLTLPMVATLTNAGSLLLGCINSKLLDLVEIEELAIMVRRVDDIKIVNGHRTGHLDGHDFFLLGIVDFIALGNEFVGDVLDVFLYLFHFVFGNGFVFEFLYFVHYVTTSVADVYFTVFNFALGGFGEFFAALFGEGRYDDAENLAFVARRETEVGIEDGFVDGTKDAFLPRLDNDAACIGGVDVGYLADLGGGAVVVNFYTVEHAGIGFASTNLC